MGVFFIFMIIAVISGIIRVAARAQRATGLIWQAAATDLGLGFEPGSWTKQPRIAGQRNGFDIEVAAQVTTQRQQQSGRDARTESPTRSSATR